MTVADRIAAWLVERGITHAFGIIGGGNLPLWDAITRLQKTQIVCTHHEQAAAMASAYFNRVRGGVGSVALVTTGGGSSNAITGVLAASMDRVPLLVISGNEASGYMNSPARVWGVQGYDSAGVAKPFSKYATRMMGCDDMDMLDHALREALVPPRGPCWIDIPKDIQGARADG